MTSETVVLATVKRQWVGTRAAVLLALAIGMTALHGWSLMRYPAPFVDEAWNANRSWALITEGMAFGGLDAGVFERYPGYWTYLPMLPTVIQALPFWVIGHAELWPLRVVSLSFGGLLLLATYSIGRVAHSPGTGIVAASLMSLSPAFFYSAHLARWDVLVAALGYSALALQLSNSHRSRVRGFVGGLLIGLAFEIHPHASLFVPVALAAYAFESGRHSVRRPDCWAFLAGLAAGALAYLCLHVVRYPSSFVALASLAHGPTHTPPILTLDPWILSKSVADTAHLFLFSQFFFAIAFVVAAGWLIVYRAPAGRISGLLTLLVFCSFTLMVRNKIGYYAIYLIPMVSLTIASCLTSLRPSARRLLPDSLTAALVSAPLVIGVLGIPSLVRTDGSRDFRQVVARIAPLIASDDVLIGSQTYWFGLQDRRYYSWEQLVYYKRYTPGSDLEDAFRELRPTVLILDGHLERFVHDAVSADPYRGLLTIPNDELFAFLDERARLIADFHGRAHGRIRVFRIEWASQ